MAAFRYLLRAKSLYSPSSQTFVTHRFLSSSTLTPSHHKDHKNNHEYLQPTDFINSWKPPKDPKEAEAKLAQLRREYAKKVKEIRKQYIHEVALQKLEKQRKDEARKEAIRLANEERREAKAAEKMAKAQERKVAEEEFRQTLLKERAAKLEYWRMREKQFQEKKKAKNELLRRQSSLWVDQADLEKNLVEVIVNSTPL